MNGAVARACLVATEPWGVFQDLSFAGIDDSTKENGLALQIFHAGSHRPRI